MSGRAVEYPADERRLASRIKAHRPTVEMAQEARVRVGTSSSGSRDRLRDRCACSQHPLLIGTCRYRLCEPDRHDLRQRVPAHLTT